MRLQFHGGNGTQRAWFIEAFRSMQGHKWIRWFSEPGHFEQVAEIYELYPLDWLPIVVDVEWVADPDPTIDTDWAHTGNDLIIYDRIGLSAVPGGLPGEATELLPNWIPNLDPEVGEDQRIRWPHSTIRIKNGIEDNKARYLDVVRHELAHVAHSGLTEDGIQLICDAFGRPRSDFADMDLPWGRRVLEASCETFKDIFFDGSGPRYATNRSQLALPQSRLLDWLVAISPNRGFNIVEPAPSPEHGGISGTLDWLSQPGRDIDRHLAFIPPEDLPLQQHSHFDTGLNLGGPSTVSGQPFVWQQDSTLGGYQKQWTGPGSFGMLGMFSPRPPIPPTEDTDPYPIVWIYEIPITGFGTLENHLGEGALLTTAIDLGNLYTGIDGGYIFGAPYQCYEYATTGTYPFVSIQINVADLDTGRPCVLLDMETDNDEFPPFADEWAYLIENVWDGGGLEQAGTVRWTDRPGPPLASWSWGPGELILGRLCDYDNVRPVEIVDRETGAGLGRYRWIPGGEFTGKVDTVIQVTGLAPAGVAQGASEAAIPPGWVTEMRMGLVKGLGAPGITPPWPYKGHIKAIPAAPGNRPRKPTMGAPGPTAVLNA